jgi:type IV pilus biogenesis protein CpaD/CtpE
MKQPLIATCTVLLAGCAHFRAPDEGGAPKVAYLRNPRRQIHSVVEQPTALILLHYLRFEHRDGLRDFARRVSAGEPEDDAFAAAFPEVTAAGLEDSVTQLRSHPQSHPVAVPLRSYENAPRMESMNGAEVRGLWDFLQRTTARLR